AYLVLGVWSLEFPPPQAAARCLLQPQFGVKTHLFLMPDRLTIDTIDAELVPGARNAIRVCLQLKPEERITIITDEATRDIAAALQSEVEEVGSEHAVFLL